MAGRGCLELVLVRALWKLTVDVVLGPATEVQCEVVEVQDGLVLLQRGKTHQTRKIRVLYNWHLQDAVL